jgi:hypothetical protein
MLIPSFEVSRSGKWRGTLRACPNFSSIYLEFGRAIFYIHLQTIQNFCILEASAIYTNIALST